MPISCHFSYFSSIIMKNNSKLIIYHNCFKHIYGVKKQNLCNTKLIKCNEIKSLIGAEQMQNILSFHGALFVIFWFKRSTTYFAVVFSNCRYSYCKNAKC